MSFCKRKILLVLSMCAAPLAQSQQMDNMNMSGGMDGMNSSGMSLMEEASGTSINPVAASAPMLMTSEGGWNLMFMGQAFLVDTQQAGPRGHDKFYSANWFMTGAQHSVGKGSFKVQLMLSLEPATVTSRRYPELFQTGETAYGIPLVDAQHPHNFIMGLGFTYAYPLSKDGVWEIYYAPVGDPALGPVAFPHRSSAAELPQAPLAHHWEDSEHIVYNVVTGAVMYKFIRWEVSGFHGAEPGENRWIVTPGAIDSWASRLSIFPNNHWMAQFSVGRLNHPEAGQAGDVIRTTASLHYTKARKGGDWSSSLIWGRNHYTETGHNGNAYTLESVFPVSRKNILTGRAELVDKDELFDMVPALNGQSFRIGVYTVGYSREIGTAFRVLDSALGVNATTYSLPGEIKPYYGDRPWGVSLYLRVRLKQPSH
jgi:hypothetical protein